MLNRVGWKITGRTQPGALPADWRAQLATRLGQRPRRIGVLAELALYGALDCLDAAGESGLPKNDLIRLSSLSGAKSAIFRTLEQNRDDLPLPFSFLQSQTSQVLAALSVALNWQGDASIILARDPVDVAVLACRLAGSEGMLLGWVEEENPTCSLWLRLAPCNLPSAEFLPATNFEQMVAAKTSYWRLARTGLEIAHGNPASEAAP